MNARTIRSLCLATLGATILGTVPALQATDVVAIRMRGRYFSEPATVRITVTVEPDVRNRALVIQADGDRLFRSSQRELPGEDGARVHTFEFRNLPAGNYTIRAEVLSSSAVRGRAEHQLVVGDPGDQ